MVAHAFVPMRTIVCDVNRIGVGDRTGTVPSETAVSGPPQRLARTDSAELLRRAARGATPGLPAH